MDLSILILCRGNITRSPFIAGYLHHLYRNSELIGKISLDIDSSGIEGKDSRPVHPKILEMGYKLGFDLAMYRSKHSDLKSMERADIIFVTDSRQLQRFKKNYHHLMDKVFHIGDFGRNGDHKITDIKDPSHINADSAFDEFFEHIIPETERIWEYIRQIYYKSLDEGVKFGPGLFLKKTDNTIHFPKRYNIFTKRLFPLCPHCQSKRIRRTKRSGFLQRNVYPIFNGYPFHCGSCNRNIILFIGSSLGTKRNYEDKQQKWKDFLETDITSRKTEPEITSSHTRRFFKKNRSYRYQ